MVLLRCACRKELLSSILGGYRRTAVRLISTSEKKKDVSEACPPSESVCKKVPDFSKPLENKGWKSYGFDTNDMYEDSYKLHVTCFWLLSVLMSGTIFLYFYRPDLRRFDWCKREAFIRLNEREQLGFDPVDMNYVDPLDVELPPDEDLEEDDIII